MRPIVQLAVVALVLCGARAYSAPVYYTFAGPLDLNGGLSLPGYGPGDPVTFMFVVDTALGGYRIDDFGTHTQTDDSGAGYSFDYFFADYLGGSALAGDGAYDSIVNPLRDDHYGLTSNLGGSITTTLVSSNNDPTGYDWMILMAPRLLSEWAVGQSDFMMNNSLVADALGGGYLDLGISSSNMMLTSISSTNPLTPTGDDDPPGQPTAVPEPSTLMLLGIGLVAMTTARRRIRLGASRNHSAVND